MKNFFLFLCVFGQQKNRTNEAVGGSKGTGYCVEGGGFEKGADAFEGARDWSGNELPTERWRRAKRQLCFGKGAGGCELQRKARCAPPAARTRPKKRGALAGARQRRLLSVGVECDVIDFKPCTAAAIKRVEERISLLPFYD